MAVRSLAIAANQPCMRSSMVTIATPKSSDDSAAASRATSDHHRFQDISDESRDPYRSGSFRDVPAPCRFTFRFTHALALLIDGAHELTSAEHANHPAPVLSRAVRCFQRKCILQRLDSFFQRLQGQPGHCNLLFV